LTLVFVVGRHGRAHQRLEEEAGEEEEEVVVAEAVPGQTAGAVLGAAEGARCKGVAAMGVVAG